MTVTLDHLVFHHAALTVTNMDASVAWYTDMLASSSSFVTNSSAAQVARPWSWVNRIGRGLSCSTITRANAGETFDPARTGLDHVGFRVPDRAELVEWELRLSDKGRVKHSAITDHEWGSSLNFRDPDDMQLQVVAFAALSA